MSDAVQQGAAVTARPAFVMPQGQAGPGAPGAGGGATFEFFGPTVINAPIAGGNQVIAADSGRAEREYLFQVADVYSYWRNQYILGPASAQESPFITTDTAALVRRLVGGRPGAGAQIQRRPVGLLDAINLYRRVLLLGKPGSGKTAYLQYLALRFTQPDAPLPLLPVLIDLSAYLDSSPFLDFVRNFLHQPPNPLPPEPPFHVQSAWLADALEDYLQQGRVLLLLDGLNELPPGTPAEVAARRAQLRTFLTTYPRARAVVTCRLLDYEGEVDGAGFQTVLLDPWTVEQMAAYLQGRGDTFLLGRLQAGDPLLLSLGQVPFLLYMLTELVANYPPPADPNAIPQFLTSRSELFKQFVELLLDWATLKDQEDAALFPRQVVVTALARLAASMQAAGYRGTAVPHAWAGSHVASDPTVLFDGVPPPAGIGGDPRDKLINFACAATILDTPATRATVSFWHLTHQDYFAALAASLLGPNAALPAPVPAADDLRSLAAAMAPQPGAAIADILQSDDPRAALVAGKALAGAGGA